MPELDLNSISEKLEGLPEATKAFITSDTFEVAVERIRKDYNLIDELDETVFLKQLIILLLTDVIKQSELAGEMKHFLYRDKDESKRLADEVIQILKPVLPIPTFGSFQVKTPTEPLKTPPIVPPLKPTPSSITLPRVAPPEPKLETRPTPISTPPSPPAPPSPQPKTQLPPGFGSLRIKPIEIKPEAKPAAAPSGELAPFIIHEHKDAEAVAPKTAFEIQRPTFIKPMQPSSQPAPSQPATVKIDFGTGLENFKTAYPQPANSAGAPVKRVDYSAPAQTPAPPPKPEAKPENTELKDLPK